MSVLSQFTGGVNKLPFGVKPTAFYVDALVVGAGGGFADNASFPSASGAGGGRVVQAFNLLIEKNVIYTITVGLCPAGNLNGGNSAFGSIVAQGGGAFGQAGGSGGGRSGQTIFPTVGTYSVNDVLNVSSIISSGNSGGTTIIGGLSDGGGGGAGSPGGNAPGSTTGGSGGSGLISSIKGPGPYFYGAGRGGPSSIGPGGTGSGSGGAGTGTGGQNGGVIIAYPDTFNPATTTGAPNVFTGATATRAGYHVYEFLGSGTITFN